MLLSHFNLKLPNTSLYLWISSFELMSLSNNNIDFKILLYLAILNELFLEALKSTFNFSEILT